MYVTQDNLSGLGFNLFKAIGKGVSSLVKRARVTVQTPMGPMTIDPSNPDSVRQVQQIARSAQLQLGPPADTASQQVSRTLDAIPDWVKLAAFGGAAALVFSLASQKRH